MTTPNTAELKRALVIREQIDKLDTELHGILNPPRVGFNTTATAGGSAPQGVSKKKRQMSPEGRARIVAAQKKRWAAKKATKAK